MPSLWTDPNKPTFIKWLQPAGLCLKWKDWSRGKRKWNFSLAFGSPSFVHGFELLEKLEGNSHTSCTSQGGHTAWLQSTFVELKCVPLLDVILDAVHRTGSWHRETGHPGSFARVLFPDQMLGWWYLVWFISYWKQCETGSWTRSGLSQSGSYLTGCRGRAAGFKRETLVLGKGVFFFFFLFSFSRLRNLPMAWG